MVKNGTQSWLFLPACIVGSAIGTFLFFLAGTLFLGDPAGDWFMSAHAVFVSEKAKDLTFEQEFQLQNFVRNGIVITTDGLLSQITDFYGSIIQTLIGMFFVFGLISFFLLRWHSKREIENTISIAVEDAFGKYTKTIDYDNLLNIKIQSLLSVELENLDERITIVGLLDERVSGLEDFISKKDTVDSSSADNQNENDKKTAAATAKSIKPERKT